MVVVVLVVMVVEKEDVVETSAGTTVDVDVAVKVVVVVEVAALAVVVLVGLTAMIFNSYISSTYSVPEDTRQPIRQDNSSADLHCTADRYL